MQIVAIGRHRVGQCVCYALVSNQSEHTLGIAVDVFVKSMGHVDSTEAVMTDKTISFMQSVYRRLPAASLFLCKFHALRAVKRKLEKTDRRCRHSHVGGPAS